MSENLMGGLLSEMSRCREVLKMYEEFPEGAFGALMIRRSISFAEQTIKDNDVVQMLVAYQELKDIQG